MKRHNLFILTLTQFLRGAHTSVYGVIWQPFVLSLGASMPTLGLIQSIGGMGGIVTTLVQPLGGWFADRIGRKPFIVLSSIAFLIGYTLLALAGALNVWGLILFGAIALGASALANPARGSMTAESVQGERHGSAFSLMMVAALAPGIIAPTLGGWLADRLGYDSVFPGLLALEVIVLVLVARFLRETRAVNGNAFHRGDALRALARSFVPPRHLLGFYCAVAGDSFAWGMGWGLLNGMLTDTLHYSTEQLGIMASVMSLAWATMQMPIGRYIDRRKLKPVIVFSEMLGPPLMLIWITQTRFEIFVASQILFALTAATWVPVTSTYITRSVRAEERAEAFGRLNAFRGLIAFPASYIGGLLYQSGGMSAPLIANLIGSVIVTLILVVFVREPESSEQ